jgi:uncharacterized protein (TIGR03437 family)
VKVFFDGTQAPLLWVSSSQIGAIAPFDLDGKSNTQVRLEYQGVQSNTVGIGVVRTSPAIFSQDQAGKGAGQVYDESYQLISAGNPAVKGSTVTIFWTGGGQTDPAGVDGRIETQNLPKPRQPVTVKIGGQPAEVIYCGAVPYGYAGMLMVHAKVPAGTASGNAVPVQISVGSTSGPDGITMAVK